MKTRLINYMKASFPGIAIQTTEEARVIADVLSAAKDAKRNVMTWSASEGLKLMSNGEFREIEDTEDLLAALKYPVKNNIQKTVIIFRDAHAWPFDRDPILTRYLRDALHWAPTTGSCIVITAPNYVPHQTCEKLFTVIDYTLPSKTDLQKICDGIAESADMKIEPDQDVIRALSGFSTTEAENALALSLVETKGFDAKVIYREKVQAVKKTGLLEIIEANPEGLEGLGGLDELKTWIIKRKRAYSEEAEQFGLPNPKGVLLVGVPGSGKSACSKAFGTALGIPTVRLDIGNLFNSLVGESEARTRDALRLAEAMSPCVLWIDEIDKGFAGTGSEGSGDSGVGKRVFGSVISWMQERKRPVFLVATANNVEALPPELLRKGRFDEIWAVDLPNEDERRAIFKIHIAKRKRKTEVVDELIQCTKGFTGAEIEILIEDAMFNAFDLGRDITTLDLIQSATSTTPLSSTAKEKIEAIREWAKNRARFASRPETIKSAKTGRRIN